MHKRSWALGMTARDFITASRIASLLENQRELTISTSATLRLRDKIDRITITGLEDGVKPLHSFYVHVILNSFVFKYASRSAFWLRKKGFKVSTKWIGRSW